MAALMQHALDCIIYCKHSCAELLPSMKAMVIQRAKVVYDSLGLDCGQTVTERTTAGNSHVTTLLSLLLKFDNCAWGFCHVLKLQVHVKAGRNGRNGQLLMPTLALHPQFGDTAGSPSRSSSFRMNGKDYTFWRQFCEKPNIIAGCPVFQASWPTPMVRPTVE